MKRKGVSGNGAGRVFLQKFPLKREIRWYNRGFTLVELLISIGIFLFLGILLVSLFRSGMDLWHRGEAGKIVFYRARNVLSVIQDDFMALYRHPCPREDGEEVDVKLISDFVKDESNEYYSQRVRFVRTVSREMNLYPLNEAGTYAVSDPVDNMTFYDQFNDRNELSARTLGAPGGLMEVGYVLKGNLLYRAVKAPVGYKVRYGGNVTLVSLFDGPRFFSLQSAVLNTNARVLARNVLHYEVRFWGPDTNTWEISDPRQAGEALYEWDSTRVDPNAPEDYPFPFDDPSAAVGDPSDDIFPAKVQVMIVVDSDTRTRAMTRFVGEDAGKIVCTGTRGFVKDESPAAAARRFIKVKNEWISYSAVDGDAFVVNQRGARRTVQVSHAEGEEVYQGKLFSLIIDIPGVENE